MKVNLKISFLYLLLFNVTCMIVYYYYYYYADFIYKQLKYLNKYLSRRLVQFVDLNLVNQQLHACNRHEFNESFYYLNQTCVNNMSIERLKYVHSQLYNDLLDLNFDLNQIDFSIDNIGYELAYRISDLIVQLDKRKYVEPTYESSDTASSNNKIICDEIVHDGLFGYPEYEKGIDIDNNCSRKDKYKEMLSLLVNAVGMDFNDVKQLISEISKSNYSTLSLLIAIDSDSGDTLSSMVDSNVKIIKIDNENDKYNERSGHIWNRLIDETKTTYVFISRNIKHMTRFTKLERQLKVLTEIPDMVAVSASYRDNSNAHWFSGCYQFDYIDNYLRLIDGYLISSNYDSLFCDYLNGPFVSYTEVIKSFKFDENLHDSLVYLDLFMKFYTNNYLVNTVVDSMVFVNDRTYEIEDIMKEYYTNSAVTSEFLRFASKWDLNLIKFENKQKVEISCQELSHVSDHTSLYCKFDDAINLIDQLFEKCKSETIYCLIKYDEKLRQAFTVKTKHSIELLDDMIEIYFSKANSRIVRKILDKMTLNYALDESSFIFNVNNLFKIKLNPLDDAHFHALAYFSYLVKDSVWFNITESSFT